MSERKALTLAEWSERCFAENYGVGSVMQFLLEQNPLMQGYQPPLYTWRDRLNCYRTRFRDAWAVLTGRATIASDDW